MDLYGKILRHALFPAWESLIRGRPTLSLLDHLEQSQWRSPDELEATQVGALRRLLAHAAANVPHYRDAMAAAGFDPSRLRSVEDLARLPVLTRRDAQRSAETRRSIAQPFTEVHKQTSGTSGQPLSFGYERASEYWRQAVKLRGYAWAGHEVGARTLHYWGVHPGLAPPSLAQRAKVHVDRRLKREFFVNCGQRSDADLDAVVDFIRRERPQIIVCYAQGGADLARHVVERGLRDWPDINVLCAAEKLLDDDRALIARAFGPGVYETYGSREVMLMGMECEAHDGLHLSMENLVVEVVVRDGDTTRPAAPGEVGEVLVTDLHNFAMPFIRYANGDLAVAGPTQRCACGRGLGRIAGVDGRVSDTLRDAAGGRVAGMIFAVFLAHIGQAVKQFQAVQHTDGSLTFRYVAGPTFTAEIERYLQRSISTCLKGYPVSLEPLDEIPVSETGKRRVVIVEA
jgi:phenylacetate-CoA ligase